MFGRTARENRHLRQANKQLEAANLELRADVRAARDHREVVENDRDIWTRRAIENADRTVDTALALRDLRRENSELKARLHRQEQIIHDLQDVNERHYAELAGKAGAFAAPPVAAAA